MILIFDKIKFKGLGLISFLVFGNLSGFTQNLVVNSSFEVYNAPCLELNYINQAEGWFSAGSSPDYYNACASAHWGVPSNNFGYQAAHDGNAYVGVYTYGSDRELISSRLIKTLEKNKQYSVKFYVNLVDSCRVAVRNFGAYFSNDTIQIVDANDINIVLQINRGDTSFIEYNDDWTLIEGTFVASGNENFITIGNLTKHIDTDTVVIRHGGNWIGGSYYYIDDASVVCLDCDSASPKNNCFIPEAFSPNNDGNNDVLFVRGNNISTLHFVLYDRWGEKIFETSDKNIGWDGIYKGKELSNAVFVYYCFGKYGDGTEFKQKGDISLIR